MPNWLIRIHDGDAYMYKRKYWMNLIAVPWAISGGTTRLVMSNNKNDVLTEALTNILLEDPEAEIQISFKPWS